MQISLSYMSLLMDNELIIDYNFKAVFANVLLVWRDTSILHFGSWVLDTIQLFNSYPYKVLPC